MESNFEEEGNHVASNWEVNKEQLADIKEEIERCVKGLQSNIAARSSCCIYKVPLKLKENNGKNWYSPRIVSIGPHHYDGRDLNGDYKYQCLGFFLSRTKAKGIGLEHYMQKLYPLEPTARQCYSPQPHINHISTDGLLEMMVVDGSFILELFYNFYDLSLLKISDPLAHLKWRLPYFYVDLLLLENQIPFFVLQQLFDISKMPDDPSLTSLALRFFNNVMRRPSEVIERYANSENPPPLHLLDLVRSSLIPNDPTPPLKDADTCTHIPCFSTVWQKEDDTKIQFIPCISNLRRSGIRVRPGKADSFLEVKFKDGVVEMPSITINVFKRSLLLNCVAFEECHESSSTRENESCSSKVVTVYATFLDCLVNTTEDVQYLRERNVIENVIDSDLADDDDVALFINKLGKGLNFDKNQFYLDKVFNDVNKHHRIECNVHCASFRHKYLNSPWSCISVLAATVLLLLTIAQTYYAAIS